MIRQLIAIPTLLFAAYASAECPRTFPTQQPIVPDGKFASEAEMHRAQVAVKAYVDSIETSLACNTRLITLQQNRGVYLAEQAAASYNTQLQAYRDKEGLLATN
jgi:hypothetical protein